MIDVHLVNLKCDCNLPQLHRPHQVIELGGGGGGGGMVFNATFNNISVILWQSVLLVEESGENHQPVASH